MPGGGRFWKETQLLRVEKIFKSTKSDHQRWGRDGVLPVPSQSSDTALALGIMALQTPWSH